MKKKLDLFADTSIVKVSSHDSPSASKFRGYVLKDQAKHPRFSQYVRHQSTAPQLISNKDDIISEKTDKCTINTENNGTTCSNLDIIAGGYINTSAIAARYSGINNTRGEIHTTKKLKSSEKKRFTNQINKVFGSLKIKPKQKNINILNSLSGATCTLQNTKQTGVIDQIDKWQTLQAQRKLAIVNTDIPDSFFGKPLNEACQGSFGKFVPKFVECIINQIEFMGIETEGIYRICGRKQNIDQIIREFSQSLIFCYYNNNR